MDERTLDEVLGSLRRFVEVQWPEQEATMSEKDTAEIKATLATHGEQLASIKATLARLEPLIVRVLETQAEMRGEMRGQLDQMGQRISDVNARVPVTLGYTPPAERTRA